MQVQSSLKGIATACCLQFVRGSCGERGPLVTQSFFLECLFWEGAVLRLYSSRLAMPAPPRTLPPAYNRVPPVSPGSWHPPLVLQVAGCQVTVEGLPEVKMAQALAPHRQCPLLVPSLQSVARLPCPSRPRAGLGRVYVCRVRKSPGLCSRLCWGLGCCTPMASSLHRSPHSGSQVVPVDTACPLGPSCSCPQPGPGAWGAMG